MDWNIAEKELRKIKITSNKNNELVTVNGMDLKFINSDHQPVKLKVKLL